MQQKTILLWFRNDLRIHDNVIIHEAVRKNSLVVPVFCFNPFFYHTTPIGTLKTGVFRSTFIQESVIALRDSLRNLGSDLIIVHGKPEEKILRVATEFNVDEVYVHQEVADEENREMADVEKALWSVKIPLTSFIGHTLYHKQDLPFPIRDIPDTFTNFRKKVEKETNVRIEYTIPEILASPSLELFKELSDSNSPSSKNKPNIPPEGIKFTGGEHAALSRLKHYLWDTDLLKNYKRSRNDMMGMDYSTKLSPYLSSGCISPRRIYHEVKKYESVRGENESTYWLIFELLWRDYFRFMFKKHNNRYFRLEGLKNKSFSFAPDQKEKFIDWQKGVTGNPFIDACMKELNSTGYLSNRGRQVVASYLVNDLNVNWTWGAYHFEEMLIDYSPSSNWGNWAYIAGVGNDPRENRYFNTEKQAIEHDPKGLYMDYWNNHISRFQ